MLDVLSQSVIIKSHCCFLSFFIFFTLIRYISTLLWRCRYKILFLDVLFPLSVNKFIFVDADQVVDIICCYVSLACPSSSLSRAAVQTIEPCLCVCVCYVSVVYVVILLSIYLCSVLWRRHQSILSCWQCFIFCDRVNLNSNVGIQFKLLSKIHSWHLTIKLITIWTLCSGHCRSFCQFYDHVLHHFNCKVFLNTAHSPFLLNTVCVFILL